jgi:nucleobase transporter 1/2
MPPCAAHVRFLSPLAAFPFVTLSGLGLFYFTFPGVSEQNL